MNRREFMKESAAAAGMVFCGCGLAKAALGPPQAASGNRKRREVSVAGRRTRTIDIHAHCFSPEVWDLVKDKEKTNPFGGGETGRLLNLQNFADRLAQMDERGIDMQLLSMNPVWHWPERALASEIARVHNHTVSQFCAAHPDRFAGLGTVALQHPDLAAEQLQEAVTKLGLKGAMIGGSVNDEELSAPKFHPFWAKAEELGALIFIHPQVGWDNVKRFDGNGWLGNIIGRPLESTLAISHLIFEGTLDRFPRLKICVAHAGGYLPHYVGRSERCGEGKIGRCKPVQKLPSEYLKRLYYDELVFTSEGLRHLIAQVGVSQVTLGTDYPGDWSAPDAVDFVLRAPGLSNADRRAILGGNAEELLKIRA